MVQLIEEAPAKSCTCGNCKAKLSYQFKDITSKVESDYTGDKETVYRITCPACGTSVAVRQW